MSESTSYSRQFIHNMYNDVGTSLTVIGFALPFIIGGYGSYRTYMNFRQKYFPNVINMSLNTIVKTQTNPNKYQIISRVLNESKIEDILFNKNAIKTLERYSRKTTTNDFFIRIQPKTDHYTICNSIVNKLQSSCALNYFSNTTKYCYKSDIFCIAILLPKFDSNKNNKKFSGLKKIRCYVTKEESINDILQYLNTVNKSIYEITNEEWMDMLDANHNKISTLLLNRWQITKQILIEYDKQPKYKDGTIKWGEPMPRVELLTTPFQMDNESNKELIRRPFYNAWPSKKYL